MKLGFIGENSLESVEKDCVFAREHGFEGLEYNYWGGFRDLTEETVSKTRAMHEKHGLRACMLGLWGWNHLAPDAAARKESHEMLRRAIDYARILHADVVVTGAGDLPNEAPGRKVAEFLKVFRPFFHRAEKAGLQLAFYALHGGSFLDSIEAFERVWEHLPDLKMKFDPANWQHHGDDYLDVVRRYGNKIGHVHIKEHLTHRGQLASQPAAGMGDIEWGKVMAFLYEHDYRGWLSFEPHGAQWSRGALRERMLILSKKYLSQFLM
ncbi:MAG: sugar phosphate isomerase/epimerase [Planctomycetes bacterium]|nr:sugar phosphate isomerase/epimerase [Planctomycetota bacterium]